MDGPQCAAMIETLCYDTWFTCLSVEAIPGSKKIIAAMEALLTVNSTLTSLDISFTETENTVS